MNQMMINIRRHALLLFAASLLLGCGASSTVNTADNDSEIDSGPIEVVASPDEQTTAPAPAATETPQPSTNRPPARNLTQSTDDEESQRVRPRSTVRRGGIRDLTFDDLEFDIERDADFKRDMLGEKIEALNEQKVILRGYMNPSFHQSGIKEFVLLRDNQECCFGPGAYVYHNVQIELEGGATTEYRIRPVTVEGTLTIKPWIGPDERCYSVYHIAAKRVK